MRINEKNLYPFGENLLVLASGEQQGLCNNVSVFEKAMLDKGLAIGYCDYIPTQFHAGIGLDRKYGRGFRDASSTKYYLKVGFRAKDEYLRKEWKTYNLRNLPEGQDFPMRDPCLELKFWHYEEVSKEEERQWPLWKSLKGEGYYHSWLIASSSFFIEGEGDIKDAIRDVEESYYLVTSVRNWLRRKGRKLPEPVAIRQFGDSCQQEHTFVINCRDLGKSRRMKWIK